MLGYTKLETRPATIAFGKKYSEFWLNHRPNMTAMSQDTGTHIALRAASPNMVDAFHAAALAQGGASDARRAYGRSMVMAITPRSSAIPTAIASRP